jgi:6-phosphogluconolactonase/glucosamine-6-phosphate isomerase/deaminase
MQFILTAGWDDGIADLTQRLTKELAAGKHVLWLVTGGSNIEASVEVMDNIPAPLTKKLTVLIADERFGEVDHADSNEAQLRRAGFNPQQGELLSVLQPNLSLRQTVKHYNNLVKHAFADSDIIIAQLGIGNDGHIAGIMIDTPSAVASKDLVIHIPSQPWDRLTLGFEALRQITADYSFAFGEPKKSTLQQLQNGTITPIEQPAQILKHLPEAYIYSDQVGEHV